MIFEATTRGGRYRDGVDSVYHMPGRGVPSHIEGAIEAEFEIHPPEEEHGLVGSRRNPRAYPGQPTAYVQRGSGIDKDLWYIWYHDGNRHHVAVSWYPTPAQAKVAVREAQAMAARGMSARQVYAAMADVETLPRTNPSQAEQPYAFISKPSRDDWWKIWLRDGWGHQTHCIGWYPTQTAALDHLDAVQQMADEGLSAQNITDQLSSAAKGDNMDADYYLNRYTVKQLKQLARDYMAGSTRGMRKATLAKVVAASKADYDMLRYLAGTKRNPRKSVKPNAALSKGNADIRKQLALLKAYARKARTITVDALLGDDDVTTLPISKQTFFKYVIPMAKQILEYKKHTINVDLLKQDIEEDGTLRWGVYLDEARIDWDSFDNRDK